MLAEFQRLHGGNRPGTYTQGDEQRVVLEYFGDRVGCFIDCGAADGFTFSNTLALAERGWGGCCIEPDPVALEALRATHWGNESIAIIGAALTGADGYVTFHSSGGGGVSTTSDAHRRKWQGGGARFTTMEVPSISPVTLLKMYPGTFEMLSVDVESANADTLELFDLTAMGTLLVVCEHDSQDRRIMEHCHRHGLTKLLYRSAENCIFAK